ncbi:MAG: hypothetical protein WD749_01285 [Phycisphaerales bacterium]
MHGVARQFAALGCAATLAAAVALPSAGCARNRRTASLPAAAVPTASPAVRGADHGMELWWWVVADARPPRVRPAPPVESDPLEGPPAPERTPTGEEVPPKLRFELRDDRAALEDALRPYLERPVPIPAGVLGRWRASGLRVVAVPPADLARIEGSIRIVGAVHRQWLGEFPQWMDLVGGPWLPESAVSGEDGVTRFAPGRVRLLGRCWSVPVGGWWVGADGGARAALRLEMVPQFQPRLDEGERMAEALRPRARVEEQGTLVTRLAAGVVVTGEDALVIVPEAPEVEWSEKKDGEEERRDGLGIATLGELMLVAPARDMTPRTRAVIILIPHQRERYELLP